LDIFKNFGPFSENVSPPLVSQTGYRPGAMHQEINKSKHQQGLCMRISASKKPNAHAL